MDDRIVSLCQMEENLDSRECALMILREECGILEEKVRCILATLNEQDRMTVEEYIRMRDDLEVLMINRAIRFGKRNALDSKTVIHI